ncbi:hypothetical protein GQ53DRAFT_881370 [Thozetella sp. PMI_491]|nr:hypothetical protein GQ53DRAFT_881370 [Thozetella sp. PMI_491]
MKPRTGCEACRQRHRRCVVRPGNTQCNGCEEAGKVCQFGPKYQFRSGATRRTRQAKGHSSDGNTLASDLLEEQSRAGQAETVPLTLLPTTSDPIFVDAAPARRPQSASERPLGHFWPVGASPKDSSTRNLPLPQPSPPVRTNISILNLLDDTPAVGHERPTPPLTQREAYLLRLYTLELAPIVSLHSFFHVGLLIRCFSQSDGCDDARHFAVAVPQLALEEPIILFGLLAWASQYDRLCNDQVSELESTYYHNKCITLLIEALSRPPETYNSVLLTAVVISRLYEEFDVTTDTQQHHLSGTRNLLSHKAVVRLAGEGGLAEAASWVHLRQTIYVGLTRKQPIGISLQTFESFGAFRKRDGTSYANRAVYIFAKIIQEFFSETAIGQSEDAWGLLDEELAAWDESKPLSFKPTYHEAADLESGRPFPTIWMISSPQVVALQHYHASKIIFCLRQCRSIGNELGFEAARIRSTNEVSRRPRPRSVAFHLATMMGLALSNQHAINAFFLPCHMLVLCGYTIRNVVQQDHTIQYLERTTKILRWETGDLIMSLRAQWAELGSFGG